MFHDWDLTQEEFDRLLVWLHPDRDVAAEKYEAIRRRVRKTIVARGCSASEEIFDETIYRVARKLPDLLLTYEGDPALYFYGVAHRVYLEYLRDQTDARRVRPQPVRHIHHEPEYACLEVCLNQLPPADKELLLRFYREETEAKAKIDGRKSLAEELGLSDNALRLRLFRLREKLAACVKKCLAQK
jgi:RNA polymerase sigma factor (sigma-70 family)